MYNDMGRIYVIETGIYNNSKTLVKIKCIGYLGNIVVVIDVRAETCWQ